MTGKADIRKWDKKKKRTDSRNTVNSYQESRATKFTPQGSGNSELIRPQSAGDLNMNTFDIINLDRMIFATEEGAGDTIAITETGIEAIATGVAAYGMKLQIPVNQVFLFKMGSVEKINVNNTNITLNGVTKINDNYLEMDAITAPAVTSASVRRLYVDSADNHLKIRTDASTPIDLESTASSGADTSLSNLNATGEAHFANPTLSNLNSTGEAHFAAPTLSNLGTTSLNAQLNLNSQRIINTDWLSFNSTSTPSSGLAVYTDTADVWVRNASGAVNLTTGLLTTSANNTFTGTNYFDTTASGSTTSAPIKFQGDGNNTAQRVLEIGKYGAHGVKFIGEILGDIGRVMIDPSGGQGTINVPGTNEPAIAIKAAMIMNTYTMYDLDTLVFSQAVSSTTPAPDNDWVYIEANTGTGTNPSLTGMTYNVPTSKTHQFKINGTQVVSIGVNGLSGSEIGTGTVAAAYLGTGTSITSKFLRGDNTWQTVSGGGSAADLDLGNLTTTSINQHLYPDSDDSKDLGASGLQWKDIYIDGTAYLDSIAFGSQSMTLPTSNGTNGQVLTTNGSSALSWETPSSGSSGANDTLSNLGSTAINAALIPASNLGVHLGSSSKKFDAGYIYQIPSLHLLTMDGTVGANINMEGGILHFDDDNDTYIESSNDDQMQFFSGGSVRMKITNSNVLFNTDISMFSGMDVSLSGTGRIDLVSTGGSVTSFDGYVAIKVGGSTKYIQIYS